MNMQQLKPRTSEFAHRCIRAAQSLPKTTLGQHIEKQLIRSATSVAANYRAVLHAQSKATFISKMSIVIEESDECEYWLELIINEEIFRKELVEPLLDEAHQLTSIFVSSRKTARKSLINGAKKTEQNDDESM